jgi:hypothetical protein
MTKREMTMMHKMRTATRSDDELKGISSVTALLRNVVTRYSRRRATEWIK